MLASEIAHGMSSDQLSLLLLVACWLARIDDELQGGRHILPLCLIKGLDT